MPHPDQRPKASTAANAADHPDAQAIADLVATGQLPQANAAATAALANPALDADERVALLALRFDCHLMRMEMAQAGADVQGMVALARRPASAARQAQALMFAPAWRCARAP